MSERGLDRPWVDGDDAAPAWRVFALLAAGAGVFVIAPDWAAHPEYAAVIVAMGVALIPAVGQRLARGLERLRAPTARTRALVAAGVFVVSAFYFVRVAVAGGRELAPVWHDEFMELLQARMLAHGRLWMPPHPLGEFFDSFFIVVKPVYAATYFPGTALLYVPGMWLHLPAWVTSVAITSGAVALLYLVVAEAIDGVAGVLAALLALSLEQVRICSVMALSHPALLLLYLATVFCYLRWRRRRRGGGAVGWTVAVGLFGGWAAVTRPLDAVCLLAPLGCAMAWRLRGSEAQRWLRTAAALAIPAMPFVAMQLALDVAVTGHWFRTPIDAYHRLNLPGMVLGFQAPPAETACPSPLTQVRDYYRLSIHDAVAAHAAAGFWRTWVYGRVTPAAADLGVPARLLLVLLPAGVWAAVARRRDRSSGGAAVILLVGAVLLLVAYAFWPPYLAHYAVMTAPAMIVLILAGAEWVRTRFAGAGGAMAVGVGILALAASPVVGPSLDRFAHARETRAVNATLARLEHRPAVVLFEYRQQMSSVHEEPVYNVETAWPDDAEVIRAHDLGPAANRRIFAYYARQGRPRYFYRYERSTGRLTPLGWAQDLAEE